MKKILFFVCASVFVNVNIWAQSRSDVNMDGAVNTADVVSVYNTTINGDPKYPTPLTFTVGDVKFNMVPVEAGSFMMGADNLGSTCKPIHKVTITNDFYIGQTEVTQALWDLISSENPSIEKGPVLPVHNLSWTQAAFFCYFLNMKLADDLPTGMSFRLPYEAEWEFAARGGKLSHGYKYSGSNQWDYVAWINGNAKIATGKQQLQSVATKLPNELGIYGMSGNIAEWCMDFYDSDYYSNSPGTDPTGPENGSYKSHRGGSYLSDYDGGNVAKRAYFVQDTEEPGVGIRLVLAKD